MAYTTINKHTDYFNTTLYTGNDTDNRAVTGIPFAPNLVWIKDRSNSNSHYLQDTVRGATKNLKADGTDAEETRVSSLKSFTSDGFTLGQEAAVNANNQNFVSWNWKAETTGSGSTTGSGTSKTYNYSVNTTAGFSITKYTGNGNSGHTIPHSLGTTPKIVIVKELSATDYWRVYHPALTANYNLYLNTTHAQDSASDGYIASVGSTTFGFGGSSNTNTVNQDGNDYIAYCFAEKTGYSKFGSYNGNNNANGTFIYTGFKPAFVIFKRTSGGTNDWILMDNKRDPHNLMTQTLYPNTSGVEAAVDRCDFVSNGIKLRGTSVAFNASGSPYIYMAFGQTIVGTNNIPCTAR